MTIPEEEAAIRNIAIVLSRKLDLYRAILLDADRSSSAKTDLARTIGQLEPMMFLTWREIRRKRIDPRNRLEDLDRERIWHSMKAHAGKGQQSHA